MALYRVNKDDAAKEALERIAPMNFGADTLLEQDLQRLLKDRIAALGDDLRVIAEEYGEFEDSKRRIDLLAIDKNANVVVIELKRSHDGGHMELQAIRYAAMVANMTWDHAVRVYDRYLAQGAGAEPESDAEQALLQFLGWDEPHPDQFGDAVRIILASTGFSKEITTSVLWLNQLELDITCVKLSLYTIDDQLMLNTEQIIPLPETESYQITLREKHREVRTSRRGGQDRSTYTLTVNGEVCEAGFKKADIGLQVVSALDSHGLCDAAAVKFLREDRSCSLPLIQTIDHMTDVNKKYGKYRYTGPPELVHDGVEYYVARNWAVNQIDAFISKMQERFPVVHIEQDSA